MTAPEPGPGAEGGAQHSADSDALASVEMYLGWPLDDEQKAFLRSILRARPVVSSESLARLILQRPRVLPPESTHP